MPRMLQKLHLVGISRPLATDPLGVAHSWVGLSWAPLSWVGRAHSLVETHFPWRRR